MNLNHVEEIHAAINDRSEEDLVRAANLALLYSGVNSRLIDPSQANLVLERLFQGFLDEDNYLYAGRLIWPHHLFDVRPKYTQDIFNKIPRTNQLLIQGGTSTSKTYSAGGWVYLDWRRDPYYTMVKVAAVNEEHLKRNLFAHILALHRNAAIPIKAKDNELYLGVEGAGEDMGFAGVMFPQGKDSTSRIRGYKPRPYRKKPHPRFGNMTRVRFLGDEGQSWSEGLFTDMGSLQSSMDGLDPIKIIIGYNPASAELPVVRKAEPVDGWRIEDLDTLYEYVSRDGWDVLRLDGLKCENVIQRKTIFPALITYEGAQKFIKGGGDTSADYYEKLRGFPPIRNAINTIIPPQYPQDYRGEAIFIERPFNLATLDCAYQGEDKAVMSAGRYGLASGWLKASGDRVVFVNPLNPGERMPRYVLQVDQLIPMENKEDTVSLADEARKTAKNLGVEPEFFAIDGTGNGFGTYSHLKKFWGNVLLIQWGEKASEMKVLAEDEAGANTLYDTVISEMWFTVRRWYESGILIISPQVPVQPLIGQLTSRRFTRVRGGLLKTESKLEYKARGNVSPDEADSFIELPFLVRARCNSLPGLDLAQFGKYRAPSEPESDIPEPDHLEEDSTTYAGDYLVE